ncbi:RNA-binding cell elongation regulator Jag/EloR [Gudongella sp. DL1XJH-153]|uniref:RNA-binding cell elongation regulator Jag/EloR n=1 Tax=Gudongella sp. DL1XJH-153 TaxID=3409804 RepID=UPI003BB4E4D6
MKFVVKTAKTVEEALQEALVELKATEKEVEYEIIEEASKGLFGLIGTKEAKIKVVLKNDPEEKADKFLDGILKGMGIIALYDISIEEDIMKIEINNISSSDMGILIGKRGNTLDSIQYLLSLAINKERENYLKVILDAEGYRAKREETLKRLANKMAEKAKYSKRPVKLEPMNPYERRIIHSALQEFEGVSTYSEGNEPYRRVVIVTK